jgi:large subunit ribosomal protein L6
MSRIGRKPIAVPDKVTVSVANHVVTVKGPLGELKTAFKPEVQVNVDQAKKEVHVSIDESTFGENRAVRALWGTTRALIQTSIEGVTKGFEKQMEVVGVGWTAAIKGKSLEMVLGFANKISMPIPDSLKVTVDKQIVKIQGPDKRLVGQFASDMRSKRKPEPYNGKGVKYFGEVIKRKSGKAFGTA